jgi:hypothetical protein
MQDSAPQIKSGPVSGNRKLVMRVPPRETALIYPALDNLMVTDKFAPSERRNELEIMLAPTQVGVSGDGDTEIGAALSSGESGPDCMMEMMQTK